MCERPGFWRWTIRVSATALRGLPQGLVWVVKAVPGMVRAIRMPKVKAAIRDPFYEFFMGIMALLMFPMWSMLASDLTLDARIVLALLSLPSFLLVMHGLYRSGGNC